MNQESLRELVEQIRAASPELGARAEQELLKEVRVAPTLVKYADPNQYEIETRRELRQVAAELMGDLPIAPAPTVDLLEEEPLEVELATTLIYEHSHYSYRQIRQAVQAAGEAIRREIIDLGSATSRTPRRNAAGLLRRTAIPLRHSDGYRRLPRHAPPPPLHSDRAGVHHQTRIRRAGGARSRRSAAKLRCCDAAHRERGRTAGCDRRGTEARENSQYAIPLGFRKRTLFKMDFAEVVYISELRTGPAGHFSYRNVAYAMYEAVAKKYPALAKYLRVHDVKQPVDLLKRSDLGSKFNSDSKAAGESARATICQCLATHVENT